MSVLTQTHTTVMVVDSNTMPQIALRTTGAGVEQARAWHTNPTTEMGVQEPILNLVSVRVNSPGTLLSQNRLFVERRHDRTDLVNKGIGTNEPMFMATSMTELDQFFITVRALNKEETIAEQLRYIYHFVKQKLQDEKHSLIDRILSHFDPWEVDVSASLSLLTVTWPWRNLLPNRRTFYTKTKNRILRDADPEVSQSVDEMLTGLD